VADADGGANTGTKRGLAARVLTPLGLFAAGYLAGRLWAKPNRYAGSLVDRTLRRLLFQSVPETEATQERSAASLVAELSHKLTLRVITHNVSSIGASAAFFVVLAIFPGLAALVSLYGLVGNPADIGTFIDSLREFVPGEVVRLIHDHLQELLHRPQTNLSTFLLSLVIALWSANSGMKALIEALNIVYDRVEERSIVKINVISAIMTMAFIAFLAIAVNIMILPELLPWLRAAMGERLLALRWLILLVSVLILISVFYYFAPCGRQTRFHIMTAGATLSATLWLALSMLFSLYLTNFANYSVTYGSLGAAAIFMTWLWLTIVTLLVGAEVDATVESLGHEPRLSEAPLVNEVA
jgi:YihY family inner membrane protein